MSTETNIIPAEQHNIAKLLNTNVTAVIGNDTLMGFEKAYLIANATQELSKLLTKEYMAPIMALQGNRLGFKTDKDDKGGYDLTVVKNCLIEAVLMGVQPFGNQFNIIAGNCYVTKEGFGYLLANMRGLKYKITPGLPRIKDDKSGGAIVMRIEYTYKGVTSVDELDIPVKMNQYMGADGLIGKATRKARAWLYNTITGNEISDGDAVDTTAEVVSSKIEKVETKSEKVSESVKGMIPPKDDPSKIPAEDLEEKPKDEKKTPFNNAGKVDKSGQGTLI